MLQVQRPVCFCAIGHFPVKLKREPTSGRICARAESHGQASTSDSRAQWSAIRRRGYAPKTTPRYRKCVYLVTGRLDRNIFEIAGYECNLLLWRRSLGQHVLTSERHLHATVEAGELTADDAVLEIGPGTGALTRVLLQSLSKRVVAVEKGDVFYRRLVEEFADAPSLTLVHGDILSMDMGETLLQREATSDALRFSKGDSASAHSPVQPLRGVVVANLPFYLTTALILRLLPLGDVFRRAVLLIQDDVAQRLTQVHPGGKTWRAVNILMQHYARVNYCFRVPRQCFDPRPAVHGAVITLDLLPTAQQPKLPADSDFGRLVRYVFHQKRKMLRNVLTGYHAPDEISSVLSRAGLDPTMRPETLTAGDFVNLAWSLNAHGIVPGIAGTRPKLQRN